jgi:hypothetical protein
VTQQPTFFMYLGSAIAIAVAVSLLIRDRPLQASLLAAGAAFLIYWARREDRKGGDR